MKNNKDLIDLIRSSIEDKKAIKLLEIMKKIKNIDNLNEYIK